MCVCIFREGFFLFPARHLEARLGWTCSGAAYSVEQHRSPFQPVQSGRRLGQGHGLWRGVHDGRPAPLPFPRTHAAMPRCTCSCSCMRVTLRANLSRSTPQLSSRGQARRCLGVALSIEKAKSHSQFSQSYPGKHDILGINMGLEECPWSGLAMALYYFNSREIPE